MKTYDLAIEFAKQYIRAVGDYEDPKKIAAMSVELARQIKKECSRSQITKNES